MELESIGRNSPDIKNHIGILREYADKCKHITEFGTRKGASTSVFVLSKAEKVVSYDIADVEIFSHPKLTFINKDVLAVEIEPTDLLFIDSLHNYSQIQKELFLHSAKVSKYIICHDTGYFGEVGEDGGEGLNKAIDEFLSITNWQKIYETDSFPGLTILQRNEESIDTCTLD